VGIEIVSAYQQQIPSTRPVLASGDTLMVSRHSSGAALFGVCTDVSNLAYCAWYKIVPKPLSPELLSPKKFFIKQTIKAIKHQAPRRNS
jgi:hypothetical protein